MSPFQLLQQLPEELLLDILERLDHLSLTHLGLSSRWCYEVTTPLTWKEVTLEDCATRHEDGLDQHDDTPLIKTLLVLASRPHLASCVQILTHRCHLPPPAIFHELPRSPFSSQTLSTDPRTIKLVRLAAGVMVKLHTLRIIFGHPNLNDALLRCFFDKHRRKTNPVRQLWLENCRISVGCNISLVEHPQDLPRELDFGGLESIRLRRLPLRPGQPWPLDLPPGQVTYARGGLAETWFDMQDGVGGAYVPKANFVRDEQMAGELHRADRERYEAKLDEDPNTTPCTAEFTPLGRLFESALRWDRRLYNALSSFIDTDAGLLLREEHDQSDYFNRPELGYHCSYPYRGSWLDPLDLEDHEASPEWKQSQLEKLPSATVALRVFDSASQTLTSLNLDWVFTAPANPHFAYNAESERRWIETFRCLFSLRFPHLRAFQLRNCVTSDTELPHGLYLLDHADIRIRRDPDAPNVTTKDLALEARQREQLDTACLEFMEAHQNLHCLAWPMGHFFRERRPLSADIARRVEAVIENLGRTLVDLRVDGLYTGIGEPHTESVVSSDAGVRDRRRRFIEDFATKMRKVESIKIEGGVPRDERREVIRALHACPLKKIVLIGVSCPLGNTWGPGGRDLADPVDSDETAGLEPEDKDAIWKYGPMEPDALQPDFQFEAQYGWPAGPPLLNTIASFHAETVEELKFCGYKGAPSLLAPTPVTTPMLSAMKHFHNLRRLIMSLWLSTFFEGSQRDSDIISYWLDIRSPTSTALVQLTDDEPEGWEKELRTKYAPDALAWRITNLIGPLLSERAKARKDGVHVRASFAIGECGGMFDMDLSIGKGAMGSDICLDYKGPREEMEPERRRDKLEHRRWF